MSAPADIVERGRVLADAREPAIWRDGRAWIEEAAAEIERLRTALRAVRACTDPAWTAQIISDALRENEQ